MVSENLSSIAMQFDDMADENDMAGFLALAGLGAAGAAIAELVQDRVAPVLKQNPDPSQPEGLLVSSIVKMVVGFVFGLVTVELDGPVAVAGAVLGIGAFIGAGVDVLDAAVTFANNRDNSTSSAPARAPSPKPIQRAPKKVTSSPKTVRPANRSPSSDSGSSTATVAATDGGSEFSDLS